ncbi:MAG: winged helix-turn-helix transcriptional regulator [Armatimonadetes bacterium]|nr:winged helix-turn-helix transcriptional regulator [Armatimonadota bacterium]
MADLTFTPRIANLYELQAALVEPKLKKLGIGWTTFQLLSAVHGAGTEASQAEVARRLGVTPATLSESVTQHVEKGLLEQTKNSSDKRLKVLVLTKKATKVLSQVMNLLEDVEKVMVSGVGENTGASALKALDKMAKNLEKAVSSESR